MRRRAMLEAAQSVFAEKGYARATLDEIAEQAEFGKGTLYNYFEDGKEGLLFAIFDEVYNDLHEMIRSAFAADSTEDRSVRDAFRTLVVRSFTYYEEREDLFLILIKEAHRLCFSNDRDKAAYFQQQQQRMIEALVPAVERSMSEGRIASLPLQPVAHMLLEVVHDMIVHRCMAERSEQNVGDRSDCVCAPDGSVLEDAETAADFLTTLLFDGLETSSTPTRSS